jgi:pyrroline-5-carboxylate reductase
MIAACIEKHWSFGVKKMASIAFIGAGNMAEAIARGLLRTAAYRPADIFAVDPNADRRRVFADDLGIPCNNDSCDVKVAAADVVVLAVKPFVVGEALQQIQPRADALFISIAAGISTAFIEQTLATKKSPIVAPRVIRVMPNTPMLVGKGISALCRGKNASEHDLIAAERSFSAGGTTVRVNEDLMDAVTALSGSGPAYVFYLTEALTQAGMAVGLTDVQAAQLARQTVIGSAELLAQAKDSPEELRRKVTTPNGTTQAAVETLQAGDFSGLMGKAIAAAAKRSKELQK